MFILLVCSLFKKQNNLNFCLEQLFKALLNVGFVWTSAVGWIEQLRKLKREKVKLERIHLKSILPTSGLGTNNDFPFNSKFSVRESKFNYSDGI